MPVITRANLDYCFEIARPRDKKDYGYGGVWVKNDVNRTTDCSGIVTHMLDAATNGAAMTWSRHGLSTEAYRYRGGNENDPNRAGAIGPFGTVRVLRPGDIPADAAVRIGLFHGPGGGANSHMACTIDGVNIESSGSYGQRVGGPARGYNHSMFKDWFYLPSGGGITPQPQAPGSIYLQVGSMGDQVKQLQTKLNTLDYISPKLEVDGDFGPATEAAVRQVQQVNRLTIDGVSGPATNALLGLFGLGAPPPPPPGAPVQQTFEQWLDAATERELLRYVAEQLGNGHPAWPTAGTTMRDKLFELAKKWSI